MSETTREIISQARAELESAARAGLPLPSWFEELECIITPAGRRRFAELLGNAQGQRQTATPVAVQDSVVKLQDERVTKQQNDAPGN